MDDIRYILEEEGVLNEFGIKVVGQVAALIDLPSVSEYKAAHSDWGYGDAYAVGESAPYELYILTRANGTHPNDYWFEIGEFPVAGPQGPQGATGATGATPSISVAANTTTLSAGQSASVSVAKSGTAAEPLLTFSFEIPQGAQGIQGIQGIQGPVGQQGPQGIQGQKGDPGYLYTIVGQVNDAQHLPLPTTVSRDAAFLVGTQEPYDVYVLIGQEVQELEWINLGEIATVVPNTYVLSDTYAESGTIDAQTLATINNQTNMYYLRNGDVFLGFSGKVAGVAYYMSLGYDTGNSKTEVGRVALNLSTGAWTINVSYVGDTPTNMVTTDTTQTITGSKTFGSVIKAGFTDVSLVGLNGVAGFRAYKPGTTTQAGQMIVTNDGAVAGSYRAVIQAYNSTQDAYNTLRIGDTEGFKYYVNNTNVFTIGNDGTIYGDPTEETGGIKIYADNSGYGQYNSITLRPLLVTDIIGEDPETHEPIYKTIVDPDANIKIKSNGLDIRIGQYDNDNSKWNEIGQFEVSYHKNERINHTDLPAINCTGLVVDCDFDYDGNKYLYLTSLPTEDPEDDCAVWSDNGTLKLSGAAPATSNTYLQKFSGTIVELDGDGPVLSFSSLTILSAIAPINNDNAIGVGSETDMVFPKGLAVSISDSADVVYLTASQTAALNNTSDKTHLGFLDNIKDSNNQDVGYGLTNVVFVIGQNRYIWDNGDEALVLQGTFNPNNNTYAYVELNKPSGTTQLYNM